MPDVKTITTMCKSGQVAEAYELAQNDCASNPNSAWSQRGLGWAIYYMIKRDVESGDYNKLIEHLEELKNLNLLTVADDGMIYDKVQWQVASFLKNSVANNAVEASLKLSTLFQKLREYSFGPSSGHSALLREYIKFDAWEEMVDFFDWWDLNTLQEEDYNSFRMQNGTSIMSLAEQAFIANSKALLRQNDSERIQKFLPKLDDLTTNHPEMTYPGYYYGKLLLKLGSNSDDVLKPIIPFARKKSSEYWVWQLLSEVFSQDAEKRMACLLRAVHCRTQEQFLVNVRRILASAYIQTNQLDRAKYHIDILQRCYATQGWRLPYEVNCWIRQPWFNTVKPSETSSVDFWTITNQILCEGTAEAIALVTYIDPNNQRATIVYGLRKRMAYKFRFKVGVGSILKINYTQEADERINIVNAVKTNLPNDLEHIKVVDGIVNKQDRNDFAFMKSSVGTCFISANMVQRYNVVNNERIKALVVLDYNRKKDNWNWVCISIKR